MSRYSILWFFLTIFVVGGTAAITYEYHPKLRKKEGPWHRWRGQRNFGNPGDGTRGGQ